MVGAASYARTLTPLSLKPYLDSSRFIPAERITHRFDIETIRVRNVRETKD